MIKRVADPAFTRLLVDWARMSKPEQALFMRHTKM